MHSGRYLRASHERRRRASLCATTLGVPSAPEHYRPPGSPDVRALRRISVGPIGAPSADIRARRVSVGGPIGAPSGSLYNTPPSMGTSNTPSSHTRPSCLQDWHPKTGHAPSKPPLMRINTKNMDVKSSKLLAIFMVVVGIIISVVVFSYVLRSIWKSK
jgi:hypothetical protein